MRSEVTPALAAARSSYRPAAKAHARTAKLLPLHPRTDPPCSHRLRVALDGTSSPHTAMSTSSQGAVLDRMDTTSHPSPGSQGDEPPPPPGPRDEAGAADGGHRPGPRQAAAQVILVQALAAAQVPRDGRSCFRPFSVSRCATGPSSSGGHSSRAQLGARGRSSALAGWPVFDGPSSAAGLSDRRICAGGLAGFLTGWAGRTFRGSPAAQLISRCGAN